MKIIGNHSTNLPVMVIKAFAIKPFYFTEEFPIISPIEILQVLFRAGDTSML